MNEKLYPLLLSVTQNVKFYSYLTSIVKDGIENKISAEDVLEKFPVVTKEMLQKEINLLDHIDISNYFKEFTSGSTGEPFACYKSFKEKCAISFSLTKARKERVPDFSVQDRILRFYGSWTPINVEKKTLLISVFYYNELYIEKYCDEIIKFQPRWIFGTPSAIYDFICNVRKFGCENKLKKGIKFKYVETTGEILLTSVKKEIEQFFGCLVVNHYGCREVWQVALSCSNGKFHIVEDNVYVEILDDNNKRVKDGEIGNIVITGLNNKSIPFIRYKIGDKGKFETSKCKCCNESKVLNVFGGRISEKILLQSGQEVSSVFLHHVFRKLETKKLYAVKKYKIVQKDVDRLLFILEVDKTYDAKIYENEIVNLCRVILGNFQYEFEYSHIELMANCKKKTFERLIKNVN